MTDPYAWQVHISTDWTGIALEADQRVIIHRFVGDQHEVITGFTDTGTPIVTIEHRDHTTATRGDPPGFLLPYSALVAIAEHVKPGPSQGEVARLERALAIEQARVDRALDVFLGRQP